jgi:tRNA 2-thiouridine synthesizing protein A
MPKTFRLDASGLQCPIPALRTQKALRRLDPGDFLEVICTDPMAEIDIPALLFKTGDALVHTDVSAGLVTIRIKKC